MNLFACGFLMSSFDCFAWSVSLIAVIRISDCSIEDSNRDEGSAIGNGMQQLIRGVCLLQGL
jgi:hypothetical protein